MSKLLIRIAGLMGALGSLQAQAELPLDFRLSGQAAHIKIKAANESLAPNVFQLRGEVAVTRGLLAGIGIQGLFGSSINDASKHDLITMDITQQSAVYVTLSDPDTQPDEMRVSLLLGYATTDIDTLSVSLGSTSDSFSGFSYGVSLQDRIVASKPIYWSVDCASYYRDDNLRIEGCGLGVNYAF